MGSTKRAKKPRSDWMFARSNGIVDHLEFSYDPTTDTARLEGAEPESSRFVRSYERDSGKEKIITSAQSKSGDVSLNPLTFLRQNFDYLVAVDTNQTSAAQDDIAVAFSYYVPEMLRTYGNEIPFIPLTGYAMLNVYPGLNPEILGWHLIIQNHLGSETVQRSKVGLVVDSELGKLDQFNSRVLPYIGGEFLPAHVQFLYATDSTVDTIQNQMLRYCHKAANAVKLAIREKHKFIQWSSNPYCRGVVEIKGKTA